jgi:hypothetical protein
MLDRVGPEHGAPLEPTTTALGDWYVNLVRVGPTQFVLCTSERSLQSVVLAARDVRSQLVPDLRRSLGALLHSLGVSSDAIYAELREMESWAIGRTASRKVLGHMRDFALNVDAAFRMAPDTPLQQLSLELGGIPCGPVHYVYPNEQAKKLLEERRGRRTRG